MADLKEPIGGEPVGEDAGIIKTDPVTLARCDYTLAVPIDADPVIKFRVCDTSIYFLDDSMLVRVMFLTEAGDVKKVQEIKVSGEEYQTFMAARPTGTRGEDWQNAIKALITKNF